MNLHGVKLDYFGSRKCSAQENQHLQNTSIITHSHIGSEMSLNHGHIMYEEWLNSNIFMLTTEYIAGRRYVGLPV